MDQSIVGSIFTVFVFVAFIGAVLWAFQSRNKAKYEEAANLIFEEDERTKQSINIKSQES